MRESFFFSRFFFCSRDREVDGGEKKKSKREKTHFFFSSSHFLSLTKNQTKKQGARPQVEARHRELARRLRLRRPRSPRPSRALQLLRGALLQPRRRGERLLLAVLRAAASLPAAAGLFGRQQRRRRGRNNATGQALRLGDADGGEERGRAAWGGPRGEVLGVHAGLDDAPAGADAERGEVCAGRGVWGGESLCFLFEFFWAFFFLGLEREVAAKKLALTFFFMFSFFEKKRNHKNPETESRHARVARRLRLRGPQGRGGEILPAAASRRRRRCSKAQGGGVCGRGGSGRGERCCSCCPRSCQIRRRRQHDPGPSRRCSHLLLPAAERGAADKEASELGPEGRLGRLRPAEEEALLGEEGRADLFSGGGRWWPWRWCYCC